LQEAKSREQRDHKRNVKQRALELIEAAGGESALSEAAAMEAAAAELAAAEASRDREQMELESRLQEPLDALRAEKERILAEGFMSWTRRDHKTFLAACERYDQDSAAAVVTEVKESADKSADEVKRYYDAFFTKGPSLLPDWKKIEEKLQRAHVQLARRGAIQRIVHEAVEKEKAVRADPFKTIAIPYHVASKTPPVKGFTEEEGACHCTCVCAHTCNCEFSCRRGAATRQVARLHAQCPRSRQLGCAEE
jgi:hypothetical protein